MRLMFHAMVTRLHSPRNLFEAAHRELPEAHHRFDDAEHWLRGLLTQRVEILAFGRFQPMRHGLKRRWIFWSGWRFCKTLAERRIVRLIWWFLRDKGGRAIMDKSGEQPIKYGITPVDVMASMSGFDFVRAIFMRQLPEQPIMQTIEPFDCSA